VPLNGPEERAKAMRSNRGRTRPERAVASGLWNRGLRYVTSSGYRRRYGRSLPGSPDLIFPKKRIAIFVDGCFWHGCTECERALNVAPFWAGKIARNQQRDAAVDADLAASEWTVIRVPEHRVRRAADRRQTIEQLSHSLVEAPHGG
jgi:DNA mismatch endonuclease, patch repair protein